MDRSLDLSLISRLSTPREHGWSRCAEKSKSARLLLISRSADAESIRACIVVADQREQSKHADSHNLAFLTYVERSNKQRLPQVAKRSVTKMSEKKEQDDRPDRTTLPGMIWNASHILDQALDPQCKGIPRQLLEGCKGVAIISVVEAGFIFSGHAGTGVLLARRQDGSWSPPSALGLAGVGFGALFGAAIKDVIILLVDDEAINSFTAMNTVKLGGEVGVAIGPVGREMSGDYNISGKGAGQALSYTFSKGIFAGVGLEGAVLRGRATDKCEMWINAMISVPPLSC